MSRMIKVEESADSEALPELLNQLLANMIDLRFSAKQAHWNIKGANFIALHELFDKISNETDEYIDLLAERIVQLDAIAEGALQMAATNSTLTLYPANAHAADLHLRAMKSTLALVGDNYRRAINHAMDINDVVTADILTEITRGLNKLQWLVGSHLT